MPANINRQVLIIPLVSLLAASGVACRNKKVLAIPPFPPAARTAPAEPMEQPPVQTAPVPSDPPPALPPPTVAPPPVEETTQPKRPVRRPSRPATTPTAPANASQPLRLGEMLTPEQERQYNLAMDQCLQRAQANIGRVSKRQLSKEQQGVVFQVQSFIEQAQSTRKTNLTAAKSLAERADVLARELARTVR
jgi:hypothetical protein